jgi:RimJ/RimL family protein N-acetyltransferase
MSPKKCSRAEFKKIVQRHERVARADQCYIYGIFEKRSGALVGAVDIFVIIRGLYQMGNLGYRIHNRYWNRGYGKEAASAALRIGFNDLKLNRLEAAINLDNKKSIALARSIGMRREGIKRRYLFENDQWTDHILYVANPEDIGLKARKAF